MNKKLQNIIDLIEQNKNLSSVDKEPALKAVKEADKELEITSFKLDRTEKVKKTTAILLEETIEELEQKRKAVEAQNRELEIETALERVRAIALSMTKPADMVDVCRTISDQLKQLNIKDIRNIQTAIIDDQNGTYLNYEYFTQYNTESILEIEIKLHPAVEEFANQILKSKDAFFTKTFEGQALKEWIEYRKNTNQNEDPLLEKSESVHYYFYSIGPGALGISTYSPINETDIAVFKRFRNVFELAYQRFIDIEQAIAQARNTQTELALERIRARTMAMQKSTELAETAKVLFQQFSALGENPDQLSVGIINEAEKLLEVWLSIQGTLTNQSFKVSIKEPIVINKMYKAWKNKKKSIVIDISGKDLEKYNSFRNSHPEFKEYNRIKNAKSKETNRRVMHCAFFKNGLLSLATPEPRPDEAMRLLERFAGVFEQTYTRFLDLQKAEAQAREAQIEAALERVRAKSMAMHNSEELADLSLELVKQVQALGVSTWFCAFNIYDDDPQGSLEWGSNGEGTFPRYRTPREGIFLRYYEAGQNGETLLINEIGENECPAHYDYLCTLPGVGEQLLKMKDAGIPFPTSQIDHVAYFKYGYIIFITYEPVPESHTIFKRFAKVFEQTYTRFLDLQKSEAQNKIIQAEIERKTNELEEARAMQLSMLPKEIPALPHLDIAVSMQTATEVGGDYYDFSTHEDGSLNIALGDATGHGMKAGIMVASMKSIFTTNASKMDIESFFATANSGVKSMGLKRMMMGFTLLNVNLNKFRMINAGLPPVFIYRKNLNSVEEIDLHGLPIGAMTISNYQAVHGVLEKGDVLLLMSDGMPELQNPAREMYGYDRFRQAFQTVAQKNPRQIVDHFRKQAEKWLAGNDPEDDLTFVVIKCRK